MFNEKTTVDTMPVVEALYRKIQPLPVGKDQLLEYLSEQVAKEFFQEIMKEAHGECVVKVGSKKNYRTGKIDDEWHICALNQVGKGRTFAWAVIALYGAITHAKEKEGGVYEYE